MTPALENSPRLRILVLCLLYLAQGLPFGFVTGTLAAYLAVNGYTLSEVAQITFVAQFPWTFKFVWGPIIDRFSFPFLRMGRRRLWIIFAQSMMVTTLFLMLLLPDLKAWMTALVWLVALHNVFASLQDVSVDAMAVDLLPEKQRGKANGFMRASSNFGAFIGGSVMGVITHRHGLESALILNVAIMLAIMAAPLLLREREQDRILPRFGKWQALGEDKPLKAPVSSMKELLLDLRLAFSLRSTRLGALLAVLILGGTTLITAAGKILFLRDLGWTLEEHSKWFSGAGYMAALVGSLTGGFLSDRFSAKRMTAIASIGLGLVWAIFSQTPMLWEQKSYVIAFTLAEQFAIGMMTVSLYAIFMTLSWPVIAGTQFTAYMALLNLSLSGGTKLATLFDDSPPFQLIYLGAGISQIVLIVILRWIDPSETRQTLGESRSRPAIKQV